MKFKRIIALFSVFLLASCAKSGSKKQSPVLTDFVDEKIRNNVNVDDVTKKVVTSLTSNYFIKFKYFISMDASSSPSLSIDAPFDISKPNDNYLEKVQSVESTIEIYFSFDEQFLSFRTFGLYGSIEKMNQQYTCGGNYFDVVSTSVAPQLYEEHLNYGLYSFFLTDYLSQRSSISQQQGSVSISNYVQTSEWYKKILCTEDHKSGTFKAVCEEPISVDTTVALDDQEVTTGQIYVIDYVELNYESYRLASHVMHAKQSGTSQGQTINLYFLTTTEVQYNVDPDECYTIIN